MSQLFYIRWPEYWSFSFSISPSNEYLELISFEINWFDILPAVWGVLKSLIWHHNLKASILMPSDFFKVQLSHLYMTTEETIALTMWTFVGKVVSLLCNTLSRFVIAFLPKSKCLWISWLQSPCTVILEPKKDNFSLLPLFPFYLSLGERTGCNNLHFWMLSFKPAFSLFSFTLIKRLSSSSSLSTVRAVSSAYLRLLIFVLGVLIPAWIHPVWHFTWCTLCRS